MTAYILLNGRYFDPAGMATAMRSYGDRVQGVMALYGGRYRRHFAQRLEVLEGAWHPRMVAMVEFPSFEQARAWYDSPEYAPLKAIRLANVRNETILVDALADDHTIAAVRPTDAERAKLHAFLAEAERRGVPPDRFHPGEPIESVLAASATEAARPPATAAAAETPEQALERVLALLPALDREGRQRVMARCQVIEAAAAGG